MHARRSREAGTKPFERPPRPLERQGATSADRGPVIVAGVRVTSPDRVLFEEMGLTKGALARYYESVA